MTGVDNAAALAALHRCQANLVAARADTLHAAADLRGAPEPPGLPSWQTCSPTRSRSVSDTRVVDIAVNLSEDPAPPGGPGGPAPESALGFPSPGGATVHHGDIHNTGVAINGPYVVQSSEDAAGRDLARHNTSPSLTVLPSQAPDWR